MENRARQTLVGIVVSCLLPATAIGCSKEARPEASAEPAAAPTGRASVIGTAAPGAIVTLEPATPRAFAPPADPRVVDQFGLQFLPDVTVAQVGQRVEFRSSEDVLHNVRVDEAATRTPVFNVATPPFGTYEHVFAKPGYYNVSCDVHPAMRASIFVAPTPYTAVADASGAFSIPDVEPGEYTARAFIGATPVVRDVAVAAPRTELALVTR